MSNYKPFLTSDVITSPFGVNKSFTLYGADELADTGVDRFLGNNLTPTLWESGSNPTGYVSTQDQYLVYRSILELYYSNFIYGDDGSPAGTASFNNDGTITGPKYTTNHYNYLTNNLPAGRYFPTGSESKIGVISIPSTKFGEHIKPGTFNLSIGPVGGEPRHTVYDDGEGNLLANSLKVGDIIYQHGMIILVSDGVVGMDGYGFVNYGSTLYGDSDADYINDFITATDITCSFESHITLYEKQFRCNIQENEYNFSTNPTLISGSSNSGVISDFATGSYFSPYVTTIGLYNNDKELVAVAKLSQPLPLSTTTDTNIIINLDV